jgi:hypothetical protein
VAPPIRAKDSIIANRLASKLVAMT